MNLKNQLFHSNPLSSENNILKFGDKITLEKVFFLSINQSIDKSLPYFLIGLHFQEIYIDAKLATLLMTI